MEIVSIPIISVIVYILMELLKGIFQKKEEFLRLVPMLSGVFGALLGVIMFYSAPEIIPAENAFMAFVVGAVSGGGSTWANQLFKQLGKKNDDNNDIIK